MMGLTIAQMRLAPIMEQRARELDLAFPGLIVWTSGRRTVYAQARAMAVNHLDDPTTYMKKTYLRGVEFIQALEMAPVASSVDGVTNIFYELMIRNPGIVHSLHYDGNAVDLEPMEDSDGDPTPDGQKVILWIKTCPDTDDFRTKEGTLPRWHWACKSSRAEVTA